MIEKSKIQLEIMEPQEKIDGIKEACKIAAEELYAAIEVPQWFVACANEELIGSNVLVSTCVGIPGGETSSNAKYAEVKMAVANGVDEISIPVNMAMVQSGDFNHAKNDFNSSMSNALGKAKIKAIIEVGQVDDDKINKALDMVVELRVDAVVISSVVSGQTISCDRISWIKHKLKNQELHILGAFLGELGVEKALKAGADRIATSRI